MMALANDVVGFSDFSSFWTVLTSQLNITQILTVLVGVGGVCVGLYFFWWGVRRALSMLKKAINGRLSSK